MIFLQRLFCLMLFLISANTWADGGGGSAPERVSEPDYTAAVAAIKVADYTQAIRLLTSYTASKPSDANAWNWLGYAERKSGNLKAAFAHYDTALKLDPKHRGAREYLGEAYLLAGDLPRAEEQLRQLDKLCWLPCEEHQDLKKAIAEYKRQRR